MTDETDTSPPAADAPAAPVAPAAAPVAAMPVDTAAFLKAPSTAISAVVDGVRRYEADAGKIIKVALQDVEKLIAHGFHRVTAAEIAAKSTK